MESAEIDLVCGLKVRLSFQDWLCINSDADENNNNNNNNNAGLSTSCKLGESRSFAQKRFISYTHNNT